MELMSRGRSLFEIKGAKKKKKKNKLRVESLLSLPLCHDARKKERKKVATSLMMTTVRTNDRRMGGTGKDCEHSPSHLSSQIVVFELLALSIFELYMRRYDCAISFVDE